MEGLENVSTTIMVYLLQTGKIDGASTGRRKSKSKDDLATAMELEEKVAAVDNFAPELLEGVPDIDLLDTDNPHL